MVGCKSYDFFPPSLSLSIWMTNSAGLIWPVSWRGRVTAGWQTTASDCSVLRMSGRFYHVNAQQPDQCSSVSINKWNMEPVAVTGGSPPVCNGYRNRKLQHLIRKRLSDLNILTVTSLYWATTEQASRLHVAYSRISTNLLEYLYAKLSNLNLLLLLYSSKWNVVLFVARQQFLCCTCLDFAQKHVIIVIMKHFRAY